MIFDTLRLYHLGHLQSVPVPDWYEGAGRLSEQSHLDWHKALDRVLGTAHMTLMDEPLAPPGWRCAAGSRPRAASSS